MKKHADMALTREEMERIKNESVKLKYLYQLTNPNDHIPPEIWVDTLRLSDMNNGKEIN